MSADLLREAASKMRERVEAARAGSPWGVIGGAPVPGAISRDFRVVDNSLPGIAMAVADVYPTGGSDHQRAMAGHIASWHPAVALAVANWLDATVRRYEFGWELGETPEIDPIALAVARAYLGSDR